MKARARRRPRRGLDWSQRHEARNTSGKGRAGRAGWRRLKYMAVPPLMSRHEHVDGIPPERQPVRGDFHLCCSMQLRSVSGSKHQRPAINQVSCYLRHLREGYFQLARAMLSGIPSYPPLWECEIVGRWCHHDFESLCQPAPNSIRA